MLPASTVTAESGSTALVNILDADQVRPGAILVQSPYDTDIYAELSEAKEAFSLEKMRHFTRLCQILGASKVEVKQIEVIKEGKTSSIEVKGNMSVTNAEVKIDNALTNVIRQMFSISSNYSGGAADIVTAEAYLRGNKLWGDSVLRGLVEQREHESNAILEQNIRISLTREANKSLSVVGKLSLPTKNIGIQSNYQQVASASEELNLTMRVVF